MTWILDHRTIVTFPLLTVSLVLMAGCGDSQRRTSAGDQAVPPTTAATTVSAPTAAPPGIPDERLAAITNQIAADQRAQTEVVQKLLQRIEQLEKRDTDKTTSAEALQKSHEEQMKAREVESRGLEKQISELHAKVGSLEAGRVLPKIAVTPDAGPTTLELERQLKEVERKNQLAVEAVEARAKELPRLTAGPEGFAISSANTNFVLRFRGLLQLDWRNFFNDNPLLEGNDGFLLRRARPILAGTVFRDFDFEFAPDFGGQSVQIFDAWMNYRYEPWLQLRAGKFKLPVGFEELQSDSTLPFNERSFVSTLIPVRNLGLSLWGNVAKGALGYSIGVFNPAGDSRNASTSNFDDNPEVAGRLYFEPFKNLESTVLRGIGFGVGGSYSQINSNVLDLPNPQGGTLPGYTTPGIQQFFAYNPVVGTVVADGAHWRLSPQATYLLGPFGLLGEFGISSQSVLNSATQARATLNNTAWQVSGQWVLTGENASFTGIIPRRPLDLHNGGWGAWQLVARFSQFDVDDDAFPAFANPTTSASAAAAWSVGLNWWLNRNLRIMTSYSRTTFDGGGAYNPLVPATTVPPATVTHQDESVFLTRLQLAF